jgi:hypothetical protein
MHRNGNRVKRARKSNPVCKSTGPDHIIRGQPIQIATKYKELAEEASEHEKQNLLQHAHHWQSVHNENRPQPQG